MKKILICFFVLLYVSFFCQESIFWKIEKDSVSSYILGTQHFFGESFVKNNELLIDKIKECKILVSENTDSLRNIVNKRSVANPLVDSLINQRQKQIEKIIPSYINLKKLTFREILSNIDGKINSNSCLTSNEQKDSIKIDDFLKREALSLKIKLIGLEKLEVTIDYLNKYYAQNLTDNQLFDIIKKKLDFISSGQKTQNCQVINDYRNRTYKYNFNVNSQVPIIVDRNKIWIEKIQKILNEHKRAFIFVGIMHLDYNNGLLEMLKQRGYKITPIKL